jgi:hypothetical protein
MSKLFTGLVLAAMTISIAGTAAALNPQPLPPRCMAGAHCGPVARPHTYKQTVRHRSGGDASTSRIAKSRRCIGHMRAKNCPKPKGGY